MRAFSYVWSVPVTWKSGGHTIRSIIVENPMLHANLMAPSFVEPEWWAIKVLHCGNRDFWLFAPVTLIYEFDPYSIEIIIIIIIERKDLGGVMSKRLQGHLTTIKTVPKRECDAKWEQSIISFAHPIHRMCKYELPTSKLLKVVVWQTYIQIRLKLYMTLLRRWSNMIPMVHRNQIICYLTITLILTEMLTLTLCQLPWPCPQHTLLCMNLTRSRPEWFHWRYRTPHMWTNQAAWYQCEKLDIRYRDTE